MKKCNKCLIDKDLSCFAKKLAGLQPSCRACQKIYRDERRAKNGDHVRALENASYHRLRDKKMPKMRQYQIDNKERLAGYRRARRVEIGDVLNERLRNFYKQHPEKRKEYNDKYYSSDTNQLIRNIRSRLNQLVRGKRKSGKTLELLGCNIDEFKSYIESKWLPGMSWDNYGKYGWHLDHIIPCISFNFEIPEHQNQCFHYTNYQPMWAKENLSKGSIVNGIRIYNRNKHLVQNDS